MLIYTPLEPNMNAAHYVARITCHITRKYLRLASKLIQDINKKKKRWIDLFEPTDFFNTYGNYI
jgi:poly(A) polymerase Pap1